MQPEDRSTPLLDPQNALLTRVQEALETNLQTRLKEVEDQIVERKKRLRVEKQKREEIGVFLYERQLELAECQTKAVSRTQELDLSKEKLQAVEARLRTEETRAETQQSKLADMKQTFLKTKGLSETLTENNRVLQAHAQEIKANVDTTKRESQKTSQLKEGLKKEVDQEDFLMTHLKESISLQKRKFRAEQEAHQSLITQEQVIEGELRLITEQKVSSLESKKKIDSQWLSSFRTIQSQSEIQQQLEKDTMDIHADSTNKMFENQALNQELQNEVELLDNLVNQSQTFRRDLMVVVQQAGKVQETRQFMEETHQVLTNVIKTSNETLGQKKKEITQQEAKLYGLNKEIEQSLQSMEKLLNSLQSSVDEASFNERSEKLSHKATTTLGQEFAKLSHIINEFTNEEAQIQVQILGLRKEIAGICETQQMRKTLISQEEANVEGLKIKNKRRHQMIENKQLFLDNLNREYERKQTDASTHASLGEGKTDTPEDRLHRLSRAFKTSASACTEMQHIWAKASDIILQTEASLQELDSQNQGVSNRQSILKGYLSRIALEAQERETAKKKKVMFMKRLRSNVARLNKTMSGITGSTEELKAQAKELEINLADLQTTVRLKLNGVAKISETIKETILEGDQEILKVHQEIQTWEHLIAEEKSILKCPGLKAGFEEIEGLKGTLRIIQANMERLQQKETANLQEMYFKVRKQEQKPLKLRAPSKGPETKRVSSVQTHRQLRYAKRGLTLIKAQETKAYTETNQLIQHGKDLGLKCLEAQQDLTNTREMYLETHLRTLSLYFAKLQHTLELNHKQKLVQRYTNLKVMSSQKKEGKPISSEQVQSWLAQGEEQAKIKRKIQNVLDTLCGNLPEIVDLRQAVGGCLKI